MKYSAQYVATKLGEHFKQEFEFTEASDVVDGEVAIDQFLSVQVGHNYLILTETLNDNKIKMFPERKSIKQLVSDIASVQM